MIASFVAIGFSVATFFAPCVAHRMDMDKAYLNAAVVLCEKQGKCELLESLARKRFKFSDTEVSIPIEKESDDVQITP